MVERILFIRLSALGDVLNTLPALAVLKRARPDVTIDWLVEDRFAEVVSEVVDVERVISFPRRLLGKPTPGAAFAFFRHLRALREKRYDVAIDFQGNLKGALQLRLARAARKIGARPAREHADLLYPTVLEVAPDLHRAARALELLTVLGIAPERDRRDLEFDRLLLPTFRVHKAVAEAVTQSLGPRDARPLVLLHPGTSRFGAFKRWPTERFARAAIEISAQVPCDVRVIAGPGEESLAAEVVAASRGAVKFQPGVHGLKGLIELLRRAALFVAADSGPLHLAAGLDIPAIGLFGPKDPALYAPPWKHALVVRQPPPCAPCTRRRCDDPICMTELPVARVVAAAVEPLRDQTRPR